MMALNVSACAYANFALHSCVITISIDSRPVLPHPGAAAAARQREHGAASRLCDQHRLGCWHQTAGVPNMGAQLLN